VGRLLDIACHGGGPDWRRRADHCVSYGFGREL